MEENRKKLYKYLNTHGNPDNSNKLYTEKTYSEFDSAYFQSEVGADKLYSAVYKWKLYKKDKKSFYKDYFCGDLTWAKATSNCVGTSSGDESTPTPSPSPSPSPGKSYKVCSGTYVNGCKDSGATYGSPNTSGVIYKLQGCIGAKQDSFFGPKTEAALKAKTGKTFVTDDEITKICSGEVISGGEEIRFDLEDQKKYWEKLKENGQIYKSGILKKLKTTQSYVYIIKRKKDGTKVPISTDSEISTATENDKLKLIESFDEFDYEVLYPINPATKVKKGEVGVLTAGLDQNDNIFVKIVKDNQGSWEPADVEESFEDESPETIQESVIKKILRLRLLEQKVTRTIGSSSDPNKTYTITKTTDGAKSSEGGTVVKTDGSSTETDAKSQEEKEKEIKASMEPIKTNVLTIIDEWDAYNANAKGMIRGLDATKSAVNTQIDAARDTIKASDSKDFCSTKIKTELKSSKQTLMAAAEQYKSVLTNEDLSYISRLVAEMNKLMDECDRIDKKYATTVKTDGKTTDSKKTDDVVIKKDDKSVVTDDESVKVDSEVKSFLEDKGFTFEKPGLDEKDKLATRSTVGEQLRNFDADGIYTEFYNDTTQVWKDRETPEDISDIKNTLIAIEAEMPAEQEKKACKKAIKRLYMSAFPAAGIREKEVRSVIEDDTVLNNLKSAIIKCDEDHNFPEKRGGFELQALYRCRNNDESRSYYGVDRYCLKDYKPLKQDNPMMQRESIVKKHIVEAIKNKKKDAMVESILKQIKRLR